MNQINFLPPAYLARQASRPRRLIEILLLTGVVAAMGVWYVVEHRRLSELERYVGTVETEAEAVHRQAVEMDRFQARREALARRAAVHQELAVPVSHTQVMATLGQMMPQALTLKSLVMTCRLPTSSTSETGPRQAAAGPVRTARHHETDLLSISMEGYAPEDMQVADFVARLSSHPLFTTVKLIYSRNADGGLKSRAFRVEVELPLDRKYLARPVAQGSVRNDH